MVKTSVFGKKVKQINVSPIIYFFHLCAEIQNEWPKVIKWHAFFSTLSYGKFKRLLKHI